MRSRSELWIFGYGSLVWRPSFPYEEMKPAYIRGWTRRFWQGSTDHRGLPGAPGRVVTLVRESESHCWGMAYRIAAARAESVLLHLDHREKGGYERHREPLHFAQEAHRAVRPVGLVYLANEQNPNYLGPASLDEIASQVRGSHGPSGSNREYVLRLARSLREIGAHDPHVFALEERLL